MSKELDAAVAAITKSVEDAVAEMTDISDQLKLAHANSDVISQGAAVQALTELAAKLSGVVSTAQAANPPATTAAPSGAPTSSTPA